MPEASNWKVLRHDPLARLSPRVLTVEGDLPNMALKRRMTLVQRDDGSLLVHNAINCDAATMAAIDALGPVSLIVVPNGYHRLDCAAWHARYPSARVVAPPSAVKAVSERVPVALTYPELALEPAITVSLLDGQHPRMGEGVFRVRDDDRSETLIFNDTLFNVPHTGGFGGFVLRAVGSSGGPRVSGVMRLVGVRDRAALAEALRREAGREGLARLIPGHGGVIDADAGAVLRGVADGLSRPAG
ncbi:MAG: hypothetical protein JNK72_01675 [Myxococcales bacterium]|nr:hypothetical protein [Myxococcales bacterium]